MKRLIINWVFFIIIICQTIFYGCESIPIENLQPVCIITSPQDGDSLDINSTVYLTVNASDNDGFIETVIVFINGAGYQFTNETNIQIKLSRADTESNSIRIQAMAIDNENGIAKDSATIWFIETSPFKGLPVKDLAGVLTNYEVLTNDTIWHIVGNCLIEPGEKLVIEPGTVISFAPNRVDPYIGFFIDTKGTLIARGSPYERIIFRSDDLSDGSWGGLVFLGETQDWNISNNTGSIVEFCEFYNGSDGEIHIPGSGNALGTITALDAYPLIRNNIFYNSHRSDLYSTASYEPSKSALILNNYFTGTIGIRSDLTFKGNIVDDDGYLSLQRSPKAIIEGNLFKNNIQYGAIVLGDDFSNIQIINNNFSNNGKCINIRWGSAPGIIRQNNFENSEYAIYMDNTPIDVNASMNYWGTADSTLIGNFIFDFNDDIRLGKINYANFSTEKYEW